MRLRNNLMVDLKSVQSRVKMPLKKLVRKARLSYDELVTVVCEIKNSIDSRPLTYLTEENCQTPLSPYYLLFERNINDRNEPLKQTKPSHC